MYKKTISTPKLQNSFIKFNTKVSIQGQQRKVAPPTTHILSLKGSIQWGPLSEAMYAIIASAPHTLYRILQHSWSAPLLHTLPTTVNSLNCIDSFCKLLRDVGLWQHPRHLENKTNITTKDDPQGNIATMHNTIKSYGDT